MTMPFERSFAVINMGKAAANLLPYRAKRKGQKVCHIPSDLVEDIVRALRHYPGEFHINEAIKKAPEVFGKL